MHTPNVAVEIEGHRPRGAHAREGGGFPSTVARSAERFCQQRFQTIPLRVRERREHLGLRFPPGAAQPWTELPALDGEVDPRDPGIVGIGQPVDQPVALEGPQNLGHARGPDPQALGELGVGQPVAGGDLREGEISARMDAEGREPGLQRRAMDALEGAQQGSGVGGRDDG